MAPLPPTHTILPKSIPNRDLLQRVSYTYQANVFLNTLGDRFGRDAVKRDRRRSGQASVSGGPRDVVMGGQDVDDEEEEEEEVPEVPELPATPHAAESSTQASNRSKARVTWTDDVHDGDSRTARKILAVGKRQGKVLQAAARSSTASYKRVLKHNMLKTDPGLKRSICKGCDAILVPGLTARVRIKPSPSHFNKIVTTCLTCTKTRTIPAPPLLSGTPLDPATILASDHHPIHANELIPSSVDDEEGAMNGLIIPETPPSPPSLSSSSAPAPSPPLLPTHTRLPPLPHSKLDGPIRAARRAKAARPIPFWEREAGAPSPADSEALRVAQAERKANKWRKKEKKVETGGKGKKSGKRHGKVDKKDGGAGHSVWVDERVVNNWGVGAVPP